ncbi:MAG: putative zinc-binding protein [Promethearchaeota archaeon]
MDIKAKYVGILSCSGEEMSGGTISRIATRKVLDNMIPGDTTTICVPLFLAGDEKEQGFVKKFPCITVDGCDKKCAARSVRNLGKEPIEEVVVDNFFTSEELNEIEKSPLHDLFWKDHPYCQKLAEHIANFAAKELMSP